jgi:LysR family cys regulon transcriptional activator
VSKQIRWLESETSLDLLVRKGNRIVGLTVSGEAIHRHAQRTLWEMDNLKKSIGEFSRADRGRLTIATTNTYARFVLPRAIRDFMLAHRNIELVLRQGTPSSIQQWILAGEADIAISNRPPDASDELVFLRCGKLTRSIIAPVGHALLAVDRLTLGEIARYPIATLDESFEGGRIVRQVFAAAKIRPNIVLSGLDPGVVKTYVGIGMGIAILPSVTFDPATDSGMQARDASHLFPHTATHIQLRRGQYVPGYLHRFIKLVAPEIDRRTVEQSLGMRPDCN